jgi:sugar lactone lactonase YvrE
MQKNPEQLLQRRRWLIWVTLLVGSISALQFANADTYSDARADLLAAYQAKDFPAMQVAAHAALQARPGYPGALFNLAFANVLAGDNDAALQVLNGLVASGADFDAAAADEFAPLQELPGWSDYVSAVAELQRPVGEATIAIAYDFPDFVPEGIVVIDESVLLGSVRHGLIVRVGEHTDVLSDARKAGHWSVFGMRLGPDGSLWFASAAVPEFAHLDEASLGSTGLFQMDIESGEITTRAILPRGDEAMVLGDFIFADSDTIYLTESLLGALYRYTISTQKMQLVIAPGSLRSMQGIVLDQSGEHLYVADYVGGLFRVRLSDFLIERVVADATTNLFGIDGLYRHGDELVAIQNGIRPNRVAAFQLGADGTSISASRVLARNLPEFDEPTLGTIVGDDFLFIANSHWNRFDRDANLPDDLSGPIILKISLLEP